MVHDDVSWKSRPDGWISMMKQKRLRCPALKTTKIPTLAAVYWYLLVSTLSTDGLCKYKKQQCYVNCKHRESETKKTELGQSQGVRGGIPAPFILPLSYDITTSQWQWSVSLMMSCRSNQRRLRAPLQWASEGKQRVILCAAPYEQLCPCPLHLHFILLTQLCCFAAY